MSAHAAQTPLTGRGLGYQNPRSPCTRVNCYYARRIAAVRGSRAKPYRKKVERPGGALVGGGVEAPLCAERAIASQAVQEAKRLARAFAAERPKLLRRRSGASTGNACEGRASQSCLPGLRNAATGAARGGANATSVPCVATLRNRLGSANEPVVLGARRLGRRAGILRAARQGAAGTRLDVSRRLDLGSAPALGMPPRTCAVVIHTAGHGSAIGRRCGLIGALGLRRHSRHRAC